MRKEMRRVCGMRSRGVRFEGKEDVRGGSDGGK